MAKQNIAETVKQLLEPTIVELGYELWDVEYVKEGAVYYLRITIDSEEGIDIDDCEKVHRTIDPMLDDADPIEESYCLQVSSPGVERILRTDEHLKFGLGQKVDAHLYKAVEGNRAYCGILSSFDDKAITLLADGNEKIFERSNISKVNIHFDFDD